MKMYEIHCSITNRLAYFTTEFNTTLKSVLQSWVEILRSIDKLSNVRRVEKKHSSIAFSRNWRRKKCLMKLGAEICLDIVRCQRRPFPGNQVVIFYWIKRASLLILGTSWRNVQDVDQSWARSFNDDTLMKRYDKIRFGISDLLIWDKKCESQKCII